jgi:hypothetical protein
MVDAPATQCVLFDDEADTAHSISLLQSNTDLLVDSGSTITIVGSADILMSYVTPLTSGIAM